MDGLRKPNETAAGRCAHEGIEVAQATLCWGSRRFQPRVQQNPLHPFGGVNTR